MGLMRCGKELLMVLRTSTDSYMFISILLGGAENEVKFMDFDKDLFAVAEWLKYEQYFSIFLIIIC